MYFLSEVEHKLLIHKLLPTAREVGVSPQLRGWSWHQPPLKPYHDARLPMYAVTSKFCPTGRDVYLRFCERAPAAYNFNIALGKLVHGAVADALLAFLRGESLDFETWSRRIRWEEVRGAPENRELLLRPARMVWDYVAKTCHGRLAQRAAEQPYAAPQDLQFSAAPFLVEHKVSGELLGLSGHLSLDCYDYLRGIMFDLKVDNQPAEWHRLAPVGYALVFESVYEVPVDVCCVVYVGFSGGRLTVRKDLFFAGDELRQWWVEERDRKLAVAAEGHDPQKPDRHQCPASCVYYRACWQVQPLVTPLTQAT